MGPVCRLCADDVFDRKVSICPACRFDIALLVLALLVAAVLGYGTARFL